MKLTKLTCYARYAALALAAALFVTGCGEQPFGIFAALEREVEADESFFVGARLRGMARVPTGNGDYYIVASGRPKWRPVDSPGAGSWGNAPRPSGYRSSGDWMISVVTVETGGTDEEVYGLFRNQSQSRYAVVEWDGATGRWGDEVAGLSSFDSARRLSRLFSANGALFVSVSTSRDGGPYHVWHLDRDTDDTTRVTDSSSEFPFSDATTHDGTTYWLVAREAVYRGVGVGPDAIENVTADEPGIFAPGLDNDPPHDNRGIFFSDHDGGFLYLASDERIYRSGDDGNTWTSVAISNHRSGDRFTRFAEYNGFIYVGADRPGGGTNGGVYKLNTADDLEDQTFRRETGMPDGSMIYRSHLAEYFVDETDDRIFALMYSRAQHNEPGLWRRDGVDEDWKAE